MTYPQETYTLLVKTRFFKERCLYSLYIKPYDKRLESAGFFVSEIEFTDGAGFALENVPLRANDWTRVVGSDGKEIGKTIQGSFPITLEDYMEIENLDAHWHSAPK